MESSDVTEWKIENLSHWCAEVHGNCIQSPKFFKPYSVLCSHMDLYPKGISGKGEHLVVRLIGKIEDSFSGELSFCFSDGAQLCKQQVNGCENGGVLELPHGPKFEDVLSRIRKGQDFLILRLRKYVVNRFYHMDRIYTTINVLTTSLKINPGWIEKMESDLAEELCRISFPLYDYSDRMELYYCLKNNIVHIIIYPPPKSVFPFVVEMHMSDGTGSDDNAVNCLKNKHVFRDRRPWTFSDPLLQKKELVGKEISLFLCLTTKNVIQRPSYGYWDYSYVSIELNNTSRFSTISPSTAPVTPDKMTILTNDSGSQTYLTPDSPADSLLVLSKELMCLYQDQKFSDLVLKCDNVTFPVHKVLLSARSPVLDRLLSSDMKEAASGTVDIGDLDPSTLSRFLTYLYTGALEDELQSESALKLYYAADKYQVPSLKRDCSKFLYSNVSISNVCDILSLADRHQDDDLTAVSQDFILNYNTVLKSKGWDTLKKNEPLLVDETLTQFAVKDRDARKDQPQ